jgi:hypothetical protein
VVRRLAGSLLVVFAVLGSGLTGMSTAQIAYAATPGTIPGGAAVRLGDPAPRYDPGRAAQEEDNSNAL